jgi:hypothetical protein
MTCQPTITGHVLHLITGNGCCAWKKLPEKVFYSLSVKQANNRQNLKIS